MEKYLIVLFLLKTNLLCAFGETTISPVTYAPCASWKPSLQSVCIPLRQCEDVLPRQRSEFCSWDGGESYVCFDRNDFSQSDGNEKKTIADLMCEFYRNLIDDEPSGIVNGSNANPGEFPHMALVGWTDEYTNKVDWKCGGSIISDIYILTAAHCTSSFGVRPDVIRIGEFDTSCDDEPNLKDYNIQRIINHPGYSSALRYHDIALIEVDGYIEFKHDVRPACLNTKDPIMEGTVIATGWGKVEKDGEKANILQKVDLEYYTNLECETRYQNYHNRKFHGIQEQQMCYGDRAGKKDACQGDSGGPIQIRSISSNTSIHKIVGVTSFGISCGTSVPGVYTKVASYVPWIESIVWCSCCFL